MQHYDAAAVAAALPPSRLIEALRAAFARGVHAPARQQLSLDEAKSQTLLLMPAWDAGGIGVKLVTVFAGNPGRGLPAVNACYLLFDADTGAIRASLDGNELTLRRTAAASALASSCLSWPDSRRMLMVGTGALAPHLIRGHSSVRPIEAVRIWGRTAPHAEALAHSLRQEGLPAQATTDLAAAAGWADIISCATLATAPLIRGQWLRPGQHVDLVGAFTAQMCEADDEALRRSEVFVDTREGALSGAGEVIQAIARGVITPAQLRAGLHELCSGQHPGRSDAASITLFKSVGHALEDLAAARLVVDQSAAAATPGAGPSSSMRSR
ncbi:MAG: ornithine cyclodeaminase family protein [Steroidobacteraceae bacterium]